MMPDGPTAGKEASPDERQGVLVVDDEPDIVESLEGIITSALAGVRVHTALSGKQALDILRRDRVDLIIADYKMPGMDGLEFLRRADEVAPGTPRILITAFPDLDIAIRAINQASIEHFFTKPLSSREIVDAVRAALFERRTNELWRETLSKSLSMLRRGGERGGR